jgi:HEAT repeat protein
MKETPAEQSHAERDRARLAHVAELARGGVGAVPELIEQLVEPAWTVRRAVVKALAEADTVAVALLCYHLRASRGNEAIIAGLVDALSLSKQDIDDALLGLALDANVAVVCDAAQILGRRESVRAVPTLKELTQHADDNVALAAIEALGRIGGQAALDSLLTLAEGRNFFRTFPTIDVLGRSGDVRVLPTLLKLAADPLYGAEAVRALARLGDPAAVPALIELLARANESLVRSIAVALVAIFEQSERRFGTGVAVERALADSPRIGDVRQQLTQSLKRADASEQIAISQALALIGEESAVPSLLTLLNGPPAVAQVAASSLKRLGTMAEAPVIEALRNGTSAQRRLLVPILSGRLAARDELVGCLEDDDPTVRALSADALARASDPAAVPALFRLLADGDARVAQAALGAIQSLGSAQTEQLAIAAARSSDPRMRAGGLRIIGYFGYPAGLDALSDAAHSDDERIRDAAIAGLPFVDDARALSLLLDSSRHASARTRTAAVRALGHSGGESHVLDRLRGALGDSDPWVRYYACQALGKLKDDSSTDAIAALLEDTSGQVRVAAVEALAHLRGQRAFEVLSGVSGSADADLHRAALVALGISKRPEALPKLLAALNAPNPATRLVAVSALAELGSPDAIPAIARATGDADEGVRASATSFLAARSDQAATSELLRLLAKAPTRQSLIHALSRPAAGRVEAIAMALANADDALSGALVTALARTQTEDAKLAIRVALSSYNDAARRAAAAALAAMLDVASAPALERAAINDPDAEVRRICAIWLASRARVSPAE